MAETNHGRWAETVDSIQASMESYWACGGLHMTDTIDRRFVSIPIVGDLDRATDIGQKTTFYSSPSIGAPKTVQDYVHGEEPVYAPGYDAVQQQQSQDASESQQAPTPNIVVNVPSTEPHDHNVALEQPMGDAPTPAEQVIQEDFKPTPTAQQRRFSAPHVEWEPARYEAKLGKRTWPC